MITTKREVCKDCLDKLDKMGFLNPYQRGLIEKGIVTLQEYAKKSEEQKMVEAMKSAMTTYETTVLAEKMREIITKERG